MVKAALKKSSSPSQLEVLHSILNAANDGCLLHKLYIEERISETHFQAGLAFAKLYSLAMRSFGIHNRIRSACQTWDQIHGLCYDHFSSTKIEGLWRYMLKALDPVYHQGIPMRNIAFSLVLTMESQKQYTLTDIRETLEYLQTIWEKIEAGPYALGLFVYEQRPPHARLH